MSTPLLAEKTPCEIEARNFKRHYTEPAIGKVYRLSFEVDKEAWDACELIPKSATIKGVIWWESEGADFVPSVPPQAVKEPEPIKTEDDGYRYNGAEKKKKKAPSGPFSAYWSRMFAKGFNNYPALIETLDCAGDQIRLRLHDVFKVETCSDISPTEFEEWMKSEGEETFASLITLSRQAWAKVQDEAA